MSAKTPSRDYTFPSTMGISSSIQSTIDWIFNQVFLMTRRGGTIRFTVFILGGMTIWIVFDLAHHPLVYWSGFIGAIIQLLSFILSPDPINAFITSFFAIFIFGGLVLKELILNLFQPDVLRHVLAISIPVFMAIRIATAYLADIFEMEDESIASRFITGSAFSTTYHRLTIENNDVAEKDRSSPILRVGGPGWIQVNLENVAVFEKADGEPHLIGPTVNKPGNVDTIQSFERLREVVDLRDQFTQAKSLVVKGRTRDGIPLIVQNVRLQFSVLRDPKASAGKLTFDQGAVKRLVFGQGHSNKRKLEGDANEGSYRGEWTDAVKGLISRELRDFIGSHTLNEFLVSANIQDISASSLNFIPRPEIKRRFLSPEFKQRAAGLGAQLNWIDIGTWDIPKLVIKEHYEAWKISSENQVEREKEREFEEESYNQELIRLIREIQMTVYQAQNQGQDDEEIRIRLISSYLALLRSVHDNFSQEDRPNLAEVEAAINYLSHFLKENLEKTHKVIFINHQEDGSRVD
jgi:hypothetical protein